jgi:hypothetical protein
VKGVRIFGKYFVLNNVINLLSCTAVGFMKSQAVFAAAKLGIADLLKDGSKSTENLAKITGSHNESLYRLLRALASIGVFAETGNRTFANTQMSTMLCSDISISLRPYFLLIGDKSWWYSWGDLFFSVKTGKCAFENIFNTGYTEYLKDNPEINQIFNDCMTNVSETNNSAIIRNYDFSVYYEVIDVGGGHGSLLASILKSNPGIKGILFEQPHVVEAFNGFDTEIKNRCQSISGDFFEEIPRGGDVYILKQIIHDWNDEFSIRILENCRKSMKMNSRLLVIDAVINDSSEQSVNKFFDLHMLVTASGGKERTKPEFQKILNSAGFELIRIINTQSSLSIIECKIKRRGVISLNK